MASFHVKFQGDRRAAQKPRFRRQTDSEFSKFARPAVAKFPVSRGRCAKSNKVAGEFVPCS